MLAIKDIRTEGISDVIPDKFKEESAAMEFTVHKWFIKFYYS
jgi:hypothetical protein